MRKFFLMLSVMLIFTGAVHAEESDAEKTDEIEFPQWALDLRRAEIVGFGSMPFTTISVTFFYGVYKYFSGESNSFPNPFDKNSSYDKHEIFSILGLSFGISAVIALADFIIIKVKRWQDRDRLKKIQTNEIITVVPATEEEIRNFKQQMNIDDGGSSESDAEDETEGKQPSEEDDAGGGA